MEIISRRERPTLAAACWHRISLSPMTCFRYDEHGSSHSRGSPCHTTHLDISAARTVSNCCLRQSSRAHSRCSPQLPTSPRLNHPAQTLRKPTHENEVA